MKNTEQISVSELAALAELTARRVQQLITEHILPGEVSRGQLPYPEAVSALIRYYRTDAASIGRERLLLLTAKRELAQQKLKEARGGDLIPVSVIKTAAAMAAGRFRNLANELYILGVPVLPATERYQTVERLGRQFADEFENYCNQWVRRQIEIAAEGNPERSGHETED